MPLYHAAAATGMHGGTLCTQNNHTISTAVPRILRMDAWLCMYVNALVQGSFSMVYEKNVEERGRRLSTQKQGCPLGPPPSNLKPPTKIHSLVD